VLKEIANIAVRLLKDLSEEAVKDDSKRGRLLMTRIHLRGEGPMELWVGKANLSPCKYYEANPPGSHIHAYRGKSDWKHLAWPNCA